MVDFDEALAPLEPKNTARMVLLGVKVNSTKSVVLIGKHAGHLNPKHQSLSAKLVAKHATALQAEDSPARREIATAMLVELLSKTVLTDWENVCEKDGKPVPFTVETCARFLTALAKKRPEIAAPRGTIDLYFGEPTNFADGYAGDVDELGKE